MRYIHLILVLPTLYNGVYGLVEPRENGSNVIIPSWEMEVTPGGDKITLNGTIEEVHAQLLQLNINWNQDFEYHCQKPDQKLDNRDMSSLERRADFKDAQTVCRGEEANPNYIEWGIAYLRKVPGKMVNGAGPGNCGRVSCEWSNAIFWCNEDNKEKQLNSCQDIADGAQWIMDKCGTTDITWPWQHYGVAGQATHPDRWSVIVRKDPC